jgi:hypothetical protein
MDDLQTAPAVWSGVWKIFESFSRRVCSHYYCLIFENQEGYWQIVKNEDEAQRMVKNHFDFAL